MKKLSALVICFAFIISGCATGMPDTTPEGTLRGTLLIKWTKEDNFYYVPDPADPLTYTNGALTVRPGPMPTDGGSIPRIFWSVKGFSPWSYGPAYILHDWLFFQHQCNPIASRTSFSQANGVLYDSIKILVKSGKADANGKAAELIKWAVDNYGLKAWNAKCEGVPELPFTGVNGITVAKIKL